MFTIFSWYEYCLDWCVQIGKHLSWHKWQAMCHLCAPSGSCLSTVYVAWLLWWCWGKQLESSGDGWPFSGMNRWRQKRLLLPSLSNEMAGVWTQSPHVRSHNLEFLPLCLPVPSHCESGCCRTIFRLKMKVFIVFKFSDVEPIMKFCVNQCMYLQNCCTYTSAMLY